MLAEQIVRGANWSKQKIVNKIRLRLRKTKQLPYSLFVESTTKLISRQVLRYPTTIVVDDA